VSDTWHLVELHGLWWAFKGELPPPETFQTHGRRPDAPILGPFPSRVIAEAMVQRRIPQGRRAYDNPPHWRGQR
jgi:hypothetical protein